MVSDLERASGPWHLEWSCVPEAFCAASGALTQTEFVLGGLVVDTECVDESPVCGQRGSLIFHP